MEPQMAAEATGIAQLRSRLAPGPAARRPPTLQMVKEALQAQDEKKGASVFTIKQFILAKYPTEDPIRLKSLLRQALSKGLRSGELVRPRNSTAVGATGTFMLAPKEPQHKRQLGQAKPDRGQAPRLGQKGTTKAPRALVARTQQQDAVKQQPTAVKQKPKANPVNAQLRAAVKPRSNGAKAPRAAKAANHPLAPVTGGSPRAAAHSQAPTKGPSGPPRAANHPRAPGSGRARPSRAAEHAQGPGEGRSGSHVAAEDAEGAGSDRSVGAGAKGPRKAPGAKGKGKVLGGAQQDVPEAQRGQGQARKSRVTPGARQGKAKKAAPPAERKAS